MKLKNVINNLDIVVPEKLLSLDVKRVVADSRKVREGDIFLLLRDDEKSEQKLSEALRKKALFALAEKDYGMEGCFVAKDLRHAFAIMNKNLSHGACDKLKIIGVTGTNGKTTITNLIFNILKGSGKKVGLIGTLGYKIDDEFVDTGFTTPDPDLLHDIFAKMLKQNVEYVVMEVSAHALYLKKLDGLQFEISVLTNITQDHLDFFKTMENYSNAKYLLFDEGVTKRAVVCSDTININEFNLRCKNLALSYAIDSPSDVFAVNIKQSFDGLEFFCNCNDDIFKINSKLVGLYNVENILAAISVCSLIGIDNKTICREIEKLPLIEGRFNVLNIDGRKIVVDFAHTPDGLEKVIQTAKSLSNDRILVLFGCGGERDEGKRPIMGRIATSLCDEVCFSSDNPRFDDPLAIIEDIKKGAVKENYFVEPDRKKAIKKLLDLSQPGDIVIIAGKGGEKYQEIGNEKVPYNDFDEIYSYFRGKLRVVGGKDEF